MKKLLLTLVAITACSVLPAPSQLPRLQAINL